MASGLNLLAGLGCHVAGLACLLAAAAAGAQSLVERTKIFNTFKASVVFIEADGYMYNGEIEQVSGSGFVVGKEGEILTNSHVVFTEPSRYEKVVVRVRFGSRAGTPRAAEIVSRDEATDIALLQAASMPPTAVPVPVSIPSFAAIGEDVTVMGYPITHPLSIVDGIVSTQVRPNVWSTTSPLNPGNSGGPVFNRYGHAIGVVTGGVVSTVVGDQSISVEGIKYFVPSDALKGILPAHLAVVQPAFAPVPDAFNAGILVRAAAAPPGATQVIFPDKGFKFVDAKPGRESTGAPTVTVLEDGKRALVKFTGSVGPNQPTAMIYTQQANKGGAQ